MRAHYHRFTIKAKLGNMHQARALVFQFAWRALGRYITCIWTAEPSLEPSLRGKVDAGFVPVLLVEVENSGQDLHHFRFLFRVGHGIVHHQILHKVPVNLKYFDDS